MSIAPNATEERPQALGRVFRHEFARALAYLRLGAIPAYIVAYFGIRRVFRVTVPEWLLEDGTLRISGKVVFPYEKRILRDAVEGTKIPDPVPPAEFQDVPGTGPQVACCKPALSLRTAIALVACNHSRL